MLRAARLGPLLARAARPALARAAPAARVLSTAVRTGKSASLDAVEDIDVDSVAYGFMASQALFTGLEVGVFADDHDGVAGQESVLMEDILSLGFKKEHINHIEHKRTTHQ